MKDSIKELWYGNIQPQMDEQSNTQEMKQLCDYMNRHHEDLMATLTDEQKVIFEKYEDAWTEYSSLSEESIFVYAFKLGMQLAIESLN